MTWESDPKLRESAIKQLSAYWPEKSTEEIDRNLYSTLVCSKDWKSIPNLTPETVRSFYENTEGVIYDLMFMETVEGEWEKPALIRDWCITHGLHNILDYAGGVGMVSRFLALFGIKVTYVDLGKVYDFAKWRFQRLGLSSKIRCIHADEFHFEEYHDFDGVVVTEFWEHVFDPIAYARNICNVVKPDGYLFTNTTSFGPHDSGHIPKHYHYSHYSNPQGDNFDKVIERETPFKLHWNLNNPFSLKIFKKQ